jgi:hypothetical protein
MAILTDNEQVVQQQFGQPVMAQNLIDGDDVFKGEKAWEYRVGDFRLIAGFYNGIGRYACFQKAALDEPAFLPEDVDACLMIIAPLSAWTDTTVVKKPAATGSGTKNTHPVTPIGTKGTTTDYQCTIKDSAGSEVGVLAWYHTTKSYLFAYCPALPYPQPAIAVSPVQMDKKFA